MNKKNANPFIAQLLAIDEAEAKVKKTLPESTKIFYVNFSTRKLIGRAVVSNKAAA